MKKLISSVCLALLAISAVKIGAQSSQPQPYKVVFDLTSSDPIDQQAVLRWIREISAVNPKTDIEVVMYARGLDLVIASKTSQATAVSDAMKSSHVNFKVCAIAMKNQQVDRSQLLANVEPVPDGIGEIVSKQKAGWGYIKVGH